VERPGLRDVLSLYGGTTVVDANSARPEVMEVVGVPAEAAAAVVALRQRVQLQYADLERLGLAKLLRAGPDQAYVIRATARPRTASGQLSDFRRTMSALVLNEQSFNNYFVPQIKRWDESSVSETPWP
jgi:predicted DNA-binding helix-hairpin-helix protein